MSGEAALLELEEAWRGCRRDTEFVRELRLQYAQHAGRPTPLTQADRLAERLGGRLRLYLKREDLAAVGTSEITSCLGQALLARRMGKTRLVTGAGSGRHGLAVASAAALLGLRCVIYTGAGAQGRGETDQAALRAMGAEVVPLASGGGIEDADAEAARDWTARLRETYFLPGSVQAGHPYPAIERDFEGVIGHEARSQILQATGRMPDALLATAERGGGAAGLFQAFLDDHAVRLFGVGPAPSGDSASVAPGGPEALEAQLGVSGRVVSGNVAEEEARAAVTLLATTEGIVPGPRSARAVAFLAREGPQGTIGTTVLLGVSDRGDGDAVGPDSALLGTAREGRR